MLTCSTDSFAQLLYRECRTHVRTCPHRVYTLKLELIIKKLCLI